MSEDQTAPGVRERFWVEKFDHSTDPPQLVETVFIENGVVQSVEKHDDAPSEIPKDADES